MAGRDHCGNVTARFGPPAAGGLDGLRHVFNDVISDVSLARFLMRMEILGQDRRRRWSNEDKLEIVTAVGGRGLNHKRKGGMFVALTIQMLSSVSRQSLHGKNRTVMW